MTRTDLERRRRAIAEALRAVMAEPFPPDLGDRNGWATYPDSPVVLQSTAPPDPSVPVDPVVPAVTPATSDSPLTETLLPEALPASASASALDVEEISFAPSGRSAEDPDQARRLSLREALMAYIDWDDDGLEENEGVAGTAQNGSAGTAQNESAGTAQNGSAGPVSNGVAAHHNGVCVPAHNGACIADDDSSAAADAAVTDDELDDQDPQPPTVPPLDTAVSMSRTASMALFGHA